MVNAVTYAPIKGQISWIKKNSNSATHIDVPEKHNLLKWLGESTNDFFEQVVLPDLQLDIALLEEQKAFLKASKELLGSVSKLLAALYVNESKMPELHGISEIYERVHENVRLVCVFYSFWVPTLEAVRNLDQEKLVTVEELEASITGTNL